MMDTIVLLLSKDKYVIIDPHMFEPSAVAKILANKSARWICGLQARQNPTIKELLSGIYKPRLTLFNHININGNLDTILKIELSLPKLMFGNNFEELKLKDFTPLIEKLLASLKAMGIETTAENLAQAPVSAIHYSKNILLTDGSTPYHYINKIKEANIKLSLDVNQTDYRNDGHSYKWHCNSYEIIFYDKIRDLEKARKSGKRALEKDNEVQLNLFEQLQNRQKFEILRMEVRLNRRQKIKHLFNKLNIGSNLIFKDLYKTSISKKILLHYLNELESKRLLLLDYKTTNDKALLTQLFFNNPDLRPKHILQIFGLSKALTIMTPRELRVIFANYNNRSWYRLMADAKKIKIPSIGSPFGLIRNHLEKFKPFRFF